MIINSFITLLQVDAEVLVVEEVEVVVVVAVEVSGVAGGEPLVVGDEVSKPIVPSISLLLL